MELVAVVKSAIGTPFIYTIRSTNLIVRLLNSDCVTDGLIIIVLVLATKASTIVNVKSPVGETEKYIVPTPPVSSPQVIIGSSPTWDISQVPLISNSRSETLDKTLLLSILTYSLFATIVSILVSSALL